jgi:hypothetical protein
VQLPDDGVYLLHARSLLFYADIDLTMKDSYNQHRELDSSPDFHASKDNDVGLSDIDLEKRIDAHRINGPEDGDTVVTAKTWAVVMV